MQIREATINDIDNIHNLGKQVDEFNVTNKVVTFWPKHILKNCIESDTDRLIIAEDKKEIIGFLIVNNNPTFKKAIIENIYITPQYRKKWIGKKLINVSLDKIKTAWCEYVCALVEEDNIAIGFYENNGFNKGRNFVWMDIILSKKFSKS